MATSGDAFLLVGTTLAGKYRIDRVIGEGGYGVVYAGLHTLIGQPVAIKCLKSMGGAGDEAARAVFLREARVLFELTHPRIVRLYDVGVAVCAAGNVPYAVLELVDGTPLDREIAARRRRSWASSIRSWRGSPSRTRAASRTAT